jgi:menaquinone-dependent protoporphyrinogen IX oxidase
MKGDLISIEIMKDIVEGMEIHFRWYDSFFVNVSVRLSFDDRGTFRETRCKHWNQQRKCKATLVL